MTDSAYSLVLFAGLLAGPASAFIVGSAALPLYVLFPAMCLPTEARRGMIRILPVASAPALVLVWGVLSGNTAAAERAVRWLAAVVTGASISGALGASRASSLLFSLSRRAGMGGLTESLAMAVSLAGPFSRRIRDVFIQSRRNGLNLTDSFERALSSVHGMGMPERDERSARSILSLLSALLAWLLLLAGIMGVV